MVKESISNWNRDLSAITPLIHNRWFLDLLFMLKNGKYGNGGFNYIENMETAERDEFLKGSISIIDNGLLVTLILGFEKIYSMGDVAKTMDIYAHRSRNKDRIARLYWYLSIGNDIMVGLEFLIGSFEFFPTGNETLGVYLFIAGSSQLLIRPIIEISKRIHLYRINRTKIYLK
ncbi:YrhK family protein [Oxyplasma meridianum]|uniref:YrhK family protein n=1 Tax=Oxyplasma meridianum TaxID=3073602 RepID=A0AAX4NI23_9ARCH